MIILVLQAVFVPLWFSYIFVYFVMGVVVDGIVYNDIKVVYDNAKTKSIQNKLFGHLLIYLFWPHFLVIWTVFIILSSIYAIRCYFDHISYQDGIFRGLWGRIRCRLNKKPS